MMLRGNLSSRAHTTTTSGRCSSSQPVRLSTPRRAFCASARTSSAAIALNSRSVIARAKDEFRPASPKRQQQQQQPEDAKQAGSTAASSPPAAPAESRCPFPHDDQPHSPVAPVVGGDASTAAAAAPPAANLSSTGSNVQGMKGPNWRVLPSGAAAAQQLPEVPHRTVVMDEFNPMGEFGEFEVMGAGAFFLNRYKEFGPVFSWQMGPTKMITVVAYEAVKSLLMADNKVIVGWNPEPFYIMLGERVRQSLENPPVRAANRRMMQPGFSKEAMAGFIGKLVSICRTQLDQWSAEEGPVNMAAKGKDLSFEFSTQLIVDFKVSPEQKPELRAKMDALFQGLFSPPDPTPGSRFSKGMEARDQLLQDMAQLLRQREDRRAAEGSSSGGGGGSSSQAMHKNVLDYTLDDMRTWNDGKLDYNVAAGSGMGLLIAANDTSGLGVSALLATLPFFPEVLDKLREEQQQVVSKHGPSLTPAALDSMSYADAVIKEVLRILPPSAPVFRKSTVDLEIWGKFVPAGVPMLLSTFMGQIVTDPHLHLSNLSKEEFAKLEGNWASVNAALLRHEFKPERWLQGAAADKPSGLLTFSAGPHVCLGMGLFMAEAKVLLALLAREYDVTLADQAADVHFKVSFFSQLTQGSVKFSKRQQLAAAV